MLKLTLNKICMQIKKKIAGRNIKGMNQLNYNTIHIIQRIAWGYGL